ncbi:MAG: PAC2 family protein [Acidimicrobiales bacterium]
MTEPDGLHEFIERPDLDTPAMLVMLDGWIDAGLGAETARATLLRTLEPVTVARFDADRLLDHRARRPVMHLDDGVLTRLEWPSIELQAAADADGNDLLLLVGAEPDHQWGAFSHAVVDLALEFGSRIVVTLGSYPVPVPHTRPPRLACSASSPELARFTAVHATVEVPAGVHAAIERRAAEVGLPAIGLWAQVPHYTATMPYPAAAAALIDTAAEVAALELDAGELRRQADVIRGRLDELVRANPEHTEMVRQLEETWDAEAGGGGQLRMTSGDDLAAEVERFLRDQGGA